MNGSIQVSRSISYPILDPLGFPTDWFGKVETLQWQYCSSPQNNFYTWQALSLQNKACEIIA
jgi:hypothetical protein